MLKFMFKTSLLVLLAGGAAAALVGPHQIKSWVMTGKTTLEEKLNEFQGMTAELRSVKSRVAELDEEIGSLKENAMREEFEIEALRREIEERDASLETLRNNLEKAGTLLETDRERFKIGSIWYTKSDIEQDVAEKMRIYDVQAETLAQLRQTLTTRQNALTLAYENVERGRAVKEELTTNVRLLEAKLERYKARQVYAEAVATDFDARDFNTEIGEARKSLALFERKLEVKNRMLDDQIRVAVSDGTVVTGIDYEQTAKGPSSVREQLSELLAGRSARGDDAEAQSLVAADR